MTGPSSQRPGLAVEIHFSAGRYHANPWGRHVNEGAAEWPPSPWRFLRALLSVWRGDGSVQEPVMRTLLAKLATTPSFHLVTTSVGHLRHYVPSDGSQRMMLDAFVVVPEPIIIAWPEQSLTREEETLLDSLLASLTYLGRADSWCECRRVPSSESPPQTRPLKSDEAFSGKTVTLLCAESSVSLEELQITTAQFRQQRLNRPPGSRWVTYTVAQQEASQPPKARGPQLAVYLVRDPGAVAKEKTLRLADRIRRELLRRHGKAHSPIFGGKLHGAPRSDDHRHLHVLPEGRGESIERVLLWAPGGVGPSEVEVLRQLTQLPAQGRQEPLRLLLWALIEEPGQEVFGQARCWISSTPYVPARHEKSGQRDSVTEQIHRECQLRGLPQPQVRLLSAPIGYVVRRPRQSKPAGPPQMVELDFPESVSGPLLLGSNSHFGMGRFVPKGNR